MQQTEVRASDVFTSVADNWISTIPQVVLACFSIAKEESSMILFQFSTRDLCLCSVCVFSVSIYFTATCF